MSSAFDHLLNALDVVLKAGARADSERQRAPRKKSMRVKGFGDKRDAAADAADASCCIVKREGQP